MPPTPRFLTLADVAEVLSTSSAQVYALVRRGELPGDQDRRAWPVAGGGRQLEDYIARMYDEARAFVDAHPFTEGDAKARADAAERPQPRDSADLGAEGDPQAAAPIPRAAR